MDRELPGLSERSRVISRSGPSSTAPKLEAGDRQINREGFELRSPTPVAAGEAPDIPAPTDSRRTPSPAPSSADSHDTDRERRINDVEPEAADNMDPSASHSTPRARTAESPGRLDFQHPDETSYSPSTPNWHGTSESGTAVDSPIDISHQSVGLLEGGVSLRVASPLSKRTSVGPSTPPSRERSLTPSVKTRSLRSIPRRRLASVSSEGSEVSSPAHEAASIIPIRETGTTLPPHVVHQACARLNGTQAAKSIDLDRCIYLTPSEVEAVSTSADSAVKLLRSVRGHHSFGIIC